MTKLHHPWQVEIKVWNQPWEYAEWESIVCGEMVAPPSELRRYYEAQWNPEDCHEFMLVNKRLKRKKIPKPLKPPKSRVVTLERPVIERRFAVALWRESVKLLTRRITPEARQLVCEMKERMEKVAGIEIYMSSLE